MTIKLVFAAVLLAASMVGAAEARNHGGSRGYGRAHYGGGHHTYSHGGSYRGAIGGSSHRGGHYSNFRTGNRYGRHR